MIDPELGAEQWDVLRVGTMRSPGVCKITGAGEVIGWDIQNASAQAGAITKRINEPLKKFTAEIELSNELDGYGFSDFDRWTEFRAYLKEMVASRTKSFARDIYHPTLAEAGITSATLGSIGLVTPDGKGSGKVSVEFLEHRPPKPLRPVASTKTEGDKKIDQATKDIADLQNEWKKLDGGGGQPISLGSSL